MKNIISLIIFTVGLLATAQTEKKDLAFKEKLNHQYAHKDSSPLKSNDRRFFKELPFYEWKKEYVVIASLTLTPESPLFTIETNTDRNPLYQQYAIATFLLNGKKEQLRIYQSQESKFSFDYKDYLFLPFKDLTNGNDTYEAGRYIDVYISDINSNQLIIDFNKAYNPYCAYNNKYSCPIPPKENHLDIEILAGVKKGIIYK